MKIATKAQRHKEPTGRWPVILGATKIHEEHGCMHVRYVRPSYLSDLSNLSNLAKVTDQWPV